VASVVTAVHGEDQLVEFTDAIGLPALADDDLARIEALIESGFVAPPEEAAAGAAPEVEPAGAAEVSAVA
jgi:hypothetical protein